MVTVHKKLMENQVYHSPYESSECVDKNIRLLLESQGLHVIVSWLFERPEMGIENGFTVNINQCELTYKVIDAETLLIVLYKKKKQYRTSLGFSLRELMWFLDLLGAGIPSLKHAIGLVDVFPYRDCQGISSNRLLRLYEHVGAQIYIEDGRNWARLKLK